MRIIGLDLSMTATGMAFPDGSTAVIKPRGVEYARLSSIEAQLEHAVRLARPDLAVVEDIQGGLKGHSAKVIPMVHAVALLVLMRAGVPYAFVNASTLKAYATGRGGADKTAMTMAAFKRTGREFRDDNECDAFWLRAAGHAAYGSSVVELPRANVETLRKVVWPFLAGAPEPLAPRADTQKPGRRKRPQAA